MPIYGYARRLRYAEKYGESEEKSRTKIIMSKITPFLWYNTQALEAAKFYTSIFPNSKIHGQEQFENSGPDENQTVQIVSFSLSGLEVQGMNAGPLFKFNPSNALIIIVVEEIHNAAPKNRLS